MLRVVLDTNQFVSTDGQALIVMPSGGTNRREKFEQALEDVNQRYGRALKRLAQ